jgi:serine phosphatase RsbU (regulator of sigma subunit)/anti-sigma regulatory factor (Ser/Thr protein kinase)/anti-anti-sigma regulatory factor
VNTSSQRSADWPAGRPAEVLASFEELPAVVWAFEGPDHRIVAANRAARASVGNRPDILGRPVREAVPDVAGQQIFELLDWVYKHDTPVTGEELRILVDRDGDGDLEEAFFSYSFLPMHHPDGTIRGMLVHVTETTEQAQQRRHAESRATESEQRYQAAQDIVLTLQRNLLPDSLPVLPGLRLAAHYRVASDELAAGGDWFDAVPFPDGTAALMVGDVVGHGAAASAAMAKLRAVALQALLSGCGLRDTLARLDAFAAQVPGIRAATVLLIVFDPATGRVEYAGHGHPPPLVLGADGQTRFLPVTPAGPLGTGSAAPEPRDEVLAPGGLLLLYSDGLVERPGRSLQDGLDELAGVASAALLGPLPAETTIPAVSSERVCELVVERLGAAVDAYRDDVTLLVAQRPVAPPRDLDLEVPADAIGLRSAAQELLGWLHELEVSSGDRVALTHAVGEAVTNGVEHAYPRTGDELAPTVALHGSLDAQGTAQVVVTDHGRWREPAPDPGSRGRGLMMMRSLVSDVTLRPSDQGTTVELRQRLSHPAMIAAAGDRPERPQLPESEEFATTLSAPPARVLAVRGPVDMTTADLLHTRVLYATRGGPLPLTLDLAEVTHLASAGVRLLHDLAADGQTLRLAVPPDRPAHQVLTLTGLADLLDPAQTASG